MKKLLICLQVYSDDIVAGETLLKTIIKLSEGARFHDADIALVHRFDCRPFDPVIVGRLQEHFDKVWVRRTRRKEIGYPGGSNGVWHDVMHWVYEMHKSRVMDYEAVLTTEADACMLSNDWTTQLLEEYRASKCKIVGFWHDSGIEGVGHINGNAMFDPRLVEESSSLIGCLQTHAWDIFHARLFEQIGWYKSSKIYSMWQTKTLPDIVIESLHESGCVWLHGVKDFSVQRWALDNLPRKKRCSNP